LPGSSHNQDLVQSWRIKINNKDKNTSNRFWTIFLIFISSIIVVAVSFSAGYLVRTYIGAEGSFDLLDEAHQLLLQHGLEVPPEAPALEYGMIRGMLEAYDDPHTTFYEPVEHELQSDSLQGSFGGIGAQLERDASGYHVLFPYSESPASTAGIQEGDRLISVDGISITPHTPVEDVLSAIRGPVDEVVNIGVARPPDFELMETHVTRAEFPLPSVTWRLDIEQPGVGIIKVNLIAASSPEEIKNAIKDLQSRGATRFLLDLRDNPGGLLTAGVDIARLFLSDGIVMQQQYRGKDIETYSVEEPGPFVDLPLAVLINKGSASAAEITAGALQAHGRAPLIGSASYGKDTVQLVIVLSDDSSLHVTSARWWIPNLAPFSGKGGLSPDIPVEISNESLVDLALLAAVQALIENQ